MTNVEIDTRCYTQQCSMSFHPSVLFTVSPPVDQQAAPAQQQQATANQQAVVTVAPHFGSLSVCVTAALADAL